ncbi:MAG: tyrosine-type recombinase/integrase [Eubacteriales bacterium]|nr:tyrosine-type recombinase/integrase [Eubacteriales bacterium]
MQEKQLTPGHCRAFAQYLREQERSASTIMKYMHDIGLFMASLDGGLVNKEAVIAFKHGLTERYKLSSANSMLVAVNSLFSFLGWYEMRVKLFKMQRQSFRPSDRELSRTEYQRLLHAAKSRSNERLYLLMQTICSTGLRVSEHRFVTVEALRTGRARVHNKGKQRLVFLPGELTARLLQYCKRVGIASGPVFVTRTGKPLDRSNIWAAMKRLCKEARVDAAKVYPHNLRHLFAVTYYRLERDLAHLADVLGHASVETTRIYTATSAKEHEKKLSRLGLLCSG